MSEHKEDYSKLFNVNMTSDEAQLVFLTAAHGKSQEIYDAILAAFLPVYDIIGAREIDQALDSVDMIVKI